MEVGKIPEFNENAVVLSGMLRVESDRSEDVRTGQAVICRKGEWVRFSTPEETEYITVCLPAFAPGLVRWDIV